MKSFLVSKLHQVIRRHQSLKLSSLLALCWSIAAIVALGLLGVHRLSGWSWPLAFPLLAAVAGSVSVALIIRVRDRRPDERAIAQKIETAYPDLRGLLLTAVQQLNLTPGALGYFQHRVIQQAVDHCQKNGNWRDAFPRRQVRWAEVAQFATLALFIAVVWQGRTHFKESSGTLSFFSDRGVTVTPGDTTIERGETLVVLARFGGSLPPGVELVVNDSTKPAQKITLVKSLADPIFGGSVTEVATDFTYRLEYNGEHTRDFAVKVFEHPRLARADADLKYPSYTNLPPKRIEDTHRVSAVEGTQLDLTLQLNKHVVSATLVARNKEKSTIPLKVVQGKAVAALAAFPLTASQSYDLKLVDAEGRANKASAPFVIEVLPNRPPELKLVSPRGDVRPSALEEIAFEGTVWDDFGVPAYGLAYSVSGKDTHFIELGHGVPAKEKRPLNQLVRLEDLGVQPGDLISWYAWADDIGPDGKVRRTSSDMFFGEVRPFDEIFRENKGMQSDSQDSQQQGQGNQSRKLVDLQKQIISATWKLQREPASPKYGNDTSVVHDSQQQALSQATDTQGKVHNPRTQALWTAVTNPMKDALKQLADAGKSPAPLTAALSSEMGAYQALLKLQARETEVTRGRSRGGQSGGQDANQRQINELDLAQEQNRYETQRQAKSPQSPQRQEQNQVLNRLQELARRQEDVNGRLKELQTALQAAHTDKEKEDIRRQLKRLQEEQQQMLADMDEVKQRMDRPENQSAMQQQREQLEKTRDDVQRAADAAGQGSVAQALASGTRAQRQLQQMRDELRKQSSGEFAEDLRQLRTSARDLAQTQEEVARKIAGLDSKQKTLSDSPERQAAIDKLEQQKKQMNDIVERASQVSQQAENSEPLLSRQLYDTVRKITQEDGKNVKDFRQELLEQGMLTRSLNDELQKAGEQEGATKSLDLTSEMLRQGMLPQAGQAAERAGAGIVELKRGVERAAESVIGDDAQALKLAQTELDAATEQLKRELAEGQGPAKAGDPTSGQLPTGGPNDPNYPNQEGSLAGGALGDNPSPGVPGQKGQKDKNSAPGSPGGDDKGLASGDSSAGANPLDPSAGQPGLGRGPGQAPSTNSAQSRGGAPQLASANGGSAKGGGADSSAAGNQGGANNGGGSRGRIPLDTLFGGDNRTNGGAYAGDGGAYNGGPITGDNFGAWADRLRNIEELVDSPALRDAVANARERARLMRQDYKRDLKKPVWAVVQAQILKPLAEVRSQIGEELARRDPKDALVPIDRDPVPNRFAQSVQRYYEELGKDK